MILLIDNYDLFIYTIVQRFGKINPTLPKTKTYDPTANSAQKLPGRQG